jgi:Ca-activated chloride channel homolog
VQVCRKASLEKKSLNLCIVIDRSGSMQGAKLETAKRSCIDIFKRLGPDDLFTVVVFDDQAQVTVNPQVSKEDVPARIEQISSGGQTNLSLGWYLGLLELQTHTTGRHTNRLFLLSDGQANQGETKRATLTKEAFQSRELGITTSTIGIGDDFQEDLLDAIATESGGRFWYIHESKIEDIVDEEFEGSLSVALDRPRIELRLPAGVTISKELNKLSKVTGKYRVRPLKGDDTFNFAVRLEASPELIEGEQCTLTALLFEGERKVLEQNASIRLVSPNEFVTSMPNPLVRSVVQQYESTVSNEQVLEDMADGNLDLMKRMLVADVGGMRRVRDALEEQRESERILMELQHVGMDLALKDATIVVVETLEEFISAPEVQSFVVRLRKIMRHGHHRMANRRHEVQDFDRDVYIDLLNSAIQLIDTLIQRYPAKAGRLLQQREKLSERLAGYH